MEGSGVSFVFRGLTTGVQLRQPTCATLVHLMLQHCVSPRRNPCIAKHQALIHPHRPRPTGTHKHPPQQKGTPCSLSLPLCRVCKSCQCPAVLHAQSHKRARPGAGGNVGQSTRGGRGAGRESRGRDSRLFLPFPSPPLPLRPYLLFEKHNLSVYYQEIQTL